MSGVRKNFIYYEGKVHTIIEKTNEPFLDLHFDVVNEGRCTICCPGHFSYYQINGNKIFLKDFVTCVDENILKDSAGNNLSNDITRDEVRSIEIVQRNINRFINFSGKLLIGSEIEPYFRFSRLGVASYWQFIDLKELVLKDGEIIECKDWSQIPKEILEVAKTLPYDDFWGEEAQGMDAAKMRTDDIWWMSRYQDKDKLQI